jgi:hypothetical protein
VKLIYPSYATGLLVTLLRNENLGQTRPILRPGIAVTALLVGLFSIGYAQNITTFDVPGSTSTGGAAINPAGQITGSYLDANFVTHGFLRKTDGTITSFDAPEAGSSSSEGTTPQGINTAGQITGYYVDANYGTARLSAQPVGIGSMI